MQILIAGDIANAPTEAQAFLRSLLPAMPLPQIPGNDPNPDATRFVERLVGADQHAGQGELVAENGLIAPYEQNLPAILHGGRRPERKDNHIDGHYRVRVEHRLGPPPVGV